MEKYRIADIQKITLNGHKVKLFKAFQYNPKSHAYIFIGNHEAPASTPNKKLPDYITTSLHHHTNSPDSFF